MLIWKSIGLLAACLTSFAFIPQVYKMYVSKSTRDVSPVTLGQLASGVFLWILYGLYLKDQIIIWANIITLVSLLAALFLYYKYCDKKIRVN